jgi:predicted NBD/HSP70 family sugar kinase
VKKTDTEQIRRANRKQIIDYLRVHAPIARVDMGAALGLSPATVTAITSDLAKEGRLIELPVIAEKNASRGRPRVLIDLAPEALHVLGLKLSINELRLMLGDQKGHIIQEQVTELQTLLLSEEGLLEALASAIRTFIAALPAKQKPKAIGIAVQGVVNGLNGEVVWSPALADKHINLKAPMEAEFKLPVTVANDANCLTIAVRHQAKYQHLKDFTVIMLGYGIGMGMVVNGELYLGHHGAAAEFGHTKYNPEGAQCLCGKRGCVEAYVGDYALFRDASAITVLPQEDRLHPTEDAMMNLVDLADKENPAIKDLFDRAGKVLGHGLANFIALMSPEKVIISGPGIRAYGHMKAGIQTGLESALVKELIAQTTVETVDWNKDMTVLGVIALALQAID